ncbi:hypothetical protein D9M73_260840 [compost metagenome]
MGVEHRRLAAAAAQVAQGLPGTGAAEAIDPGLGKALEQRLWGIEEYHLMLPWRCQAVVQQHPLCPIETATADQMNDRQWGGLVLAFQLRTRCQGLDWPTAWLAVGCSMPSALMTSSTGMPSWWVSCAGCLKRWSKNSRT